MNEGAKVGTLYDACRMINRQFSGCGSLVKRGTIWSNPRQERRTFRLNQEARCLLTMVCLNSPMKSRGQLGRNTRGVVNVKVRPNAQFPTVQWLVSRQKFEWVFVENLCDCYAIFQLQDRVASSDKCQADSSRSQSTPKSAKKSRRLWTLSRTSRSLA